MKPWIACLSAVAVAAVIGIFLWMRSSPEADDGLASEDVGVRKSSLRDSWTKGRKSRVNLKSGTHEKEGKSRLRPARLVYDDFDDVEHPYSAADKRLAQELRTALDAYEFNDDDGDPQIRRQQSRARQTLLQLAAKAAQSKNPSVRLRAVEALSCAGPESLPELTPMMADADESVAEAAIDAVENKLMEVEDQQELFQLSASYLSTFCSNEDAMTMLSGIMEGAAINIAEPSDAEEPQSEATARQNRMDVVEALETMINTGGRIAEVAKESYETITSFEWMGAEEGRLWAESPEDYEIPE